MNLEIIIPSDEPVRLLSAVTEELDYRRLTATYSRLGRIEYSPRLLFKIVLYGCSRGIYKTREIERACRENVNFMYLSETDYVQEVTVYECAGCKDCLVKEKCIRQKKTDKTPLADRVKRLNVSKYFIQQREAMEKKISTEEGILLRVNRSIQSEGVFAMIKEDMNFRRFLTRGNSNVMVEWYLVSMAYNLLKLHHKVQTGRLGKHLVVPTVA